MSSTSPIEIVRRPIGLKIFGIAISLLVLMVAVALSSSYNLNLVGKEIRLLADSYIRVDQAISEVRVQILREVLTIERLIASEDAKVDIDQAAVSSERVHAIFRQIGDCDPEALRRATREARDQQPALGRGERQLLSYRLRQLCTNDQIVRAIGYVQDALKSEYVAVDPARTRRFAEISLRLENILPERDKLNGAFEKYLALPASQKDEVAKVVREQLDTHRREINRQVGAIARAINEGTIESARNAEAQERHAGRLNLVVTGVACAIGILFAALITRSLVRPVHQLLGMTEAIRQGDLEVSIQIRTRDEIGQLADSFNHMVDGLKEKEQIKDMFGKYVDPRIVKGLLNDKQAQDGERQRMTVFFSDLAGFTTASEALTPTGTVRMLNQYFSLMAKPIRAQQGVVDKFIGDSVMAYWGPPFTSTSDHATYACHAALDQQARVPELQAMLPEILGIRKNLPQLHVRMGIATGDVTIGNIGSEDTKSYTVIGDTVNLASRLEGTNKQYGTQILINEETRRLAGETIEVREIDAIRVVGKVDPVRVFELIGRGGEITPQQEALRARYEGGLAFYRQANWEAARQAFESCLQIAPDDGPAQLLLERVRLLSEQPPPENWDGVWTMTQK